MNQRHVFHGAHRFGLVGGASRRRAAVGRLRRERKIGNGGGDDDAGMAGLGAFIADRKRRRRA